MGTERGKPGTSAGDAVDARLRSLVETLPVVIYMDDYATGTTLFVSPQVESFIGYSPSEFEARPNMWKEIVHPDDHERVEAFDEEWFRSVRPWSLEYRLIARDGNVVWVHDEAVVVHDDDGTPSRWQGVWLDITERKRAEAELARRDAVSDAVAFAARRLLRATSWHDEMNGILQHLGEASEVSRAYVYENLLDDAGELASTIRFEWDAPGAPRMFDRKLNVAYPFRDGFMHWVEELGAGRVIHGPVDERPGREKQFMNEEGVRSRAIVPVFVDAEWWGYIGLDDCVREREWSITEIDALKSAAETLGAAIHRQEADSRLQEAEQQYRALVEHIPAVLYIDVPGEEMISTYIGPQVESMLGITQQAWITDPQIWEKHLHPDEREAVVADYLDALRETDGGVHEYRMVTPDERTLWIRDEFTVLRDQAGEPTLIQGVFFDITDQKETELHLREAEQRYRTLVEQIPAIVYIDPLGETEPTLYVNQRVEEVLGYPRERWTSDPNLWWDILHPDDKDRCTERWHRSRDTGEPYSDEYRAIAADGSIHWIQEESVVLKNDVGVPAYIQGVMLDITPRKEAEGELHDALGREREASEHLRALDAMKNTLLHAVSHDIRGPLAGVMGATVLLRQEDQLSAEERIEVIEDLEASAAKMNRLVTDMLDLERVDRGIIEPKRAEVDVGALVRGVAAELARDREVGAEAESSIHVSIGPREPVTASLDAARVERILENLMRNALRHTPPGTRVDVGVERTDDGVTLLVEDRGPGVPDDLKATIFEPFMRGDGSDGGAGIGLSLVARFAELHGGTAGVEDRDGGGASFRVVLPDPA
ncbi:MAG: PAS domain-containing protein [Actinomycetota bacterium]